MPEKKEHIKGKILIVDDEQAIRESLMMVLQDEGYSCEGVSNALQALEVVETKGFDLIITDLMMPRMKGSELIRKVKKNYPEQHIIILTSYSHADEAAAALQAGADDYMLKPVDFDMLLERVKKLVNIN